MDKIDPKVAAAVWQRVQGETEIPKRRHLQGLMLQENTAFSAYQRLARQLPEHSPVLTRMAEQTRQDMACLRGIAFLQEQPINTLLPVKPVLEPAALTLRKCYGSALSMAAAYDDLSADREYGCAYEELAQRKREHSCKILGLLGSLR